MDDGGTVREAIEHHRVASGIAADGGYSDRWVVLRVGRFPMPFLNTPARRKALLAHDVNHLIAGIGAGNVGEAEISAWELASGGCGRFVAAWMLDLVGMLLGLIWPVKVTSAFASGRTMSNAYALDMDTILAMTVTELRQTLTESKVATSSSMAGSVALFVGYLLLAIPVGAVFLLMVILSLPVWVVTKE
jgi:hypothetical protein